MTLSNHLRLVYKRLSNIEDIIKEEQKERSYLSCERITEHHNFVKVIKLGKVFLHHIYNLISPVN